MVGPALVSGSRPVGRSHRNGEVPISYDTGRVLRGAAIGYACTAGFTTAVAIRDDLPGQPLGIRIPLSVPTGILVGWGAGVAAPWPMPVAALVAASRLDDHGTGTGPAVVCTALGMAGIIGLLIEPNTYDPGAWSSANRAAITAGFVASAALAAAGLRHWNRLRRAQPDVVAA